MNKDRILIVEDDFDIAKMLKLFLSYHGYCHVRVENSGVSGLEAALSRTPDLILLDIMLPEMDGLTVCRILRSTPPIRQLFPSSGSRQGMKFPILLRGWRSERMIMSLSRLIQRNFWRALKPSSGRV